MNTLKKVMKEKQSSNRKHWRLGNRELFIELNNNVLAIAIKDGNQQYFRRFQEEDLQNCYEVTVLRNINHCFHNFLCDMESFTVQQNGVISIPFSIVGGIDYQSGRANLKLLPVDKLSSQEKPKWETFIEEMRKINFWKLKEIEKVEPFQVEELDLNKDNVTRIVPYFNGQWPKLKELWLDECKIGDEGVKAINPNGFPQLKELRLAYNGITDEGIKHLAKLNCPKLTKLFLHKNSISAKQQAKALLSKSLPKADIHGI